MGGNAGGKCHEEEKESDEQAQVEEAQEEGPFLRSLVGARCRCSLGAILVPSQLDSAVRVATVVSGLLAFEVLCILIVWMLFFLGCLWGINWCGIFNKLRAGKRHVARGDP